MNRIAALLPHLSLRNLHITHLMLATVAAVAFSGCAAYQTLGQQSRANYAYVKRANLEIDILLAERDNLLAERARLKQLAASYGVGSRPSRSSSSSSSPSRSSTASAIQRQIASNEAAIARNEAQIQQARMLAAY